MKLILLKEGYVIWIVSLANSIEKAGYVGNSVGLYHYPIWEILFGKLPTGKSTSKSIQRGQDDAR